MKYLLTIALCIVLSGCTCLWTDEALYCSFLNFKQFDKAEVESDIVKLKLENYYSDPKDVKVYTPAGIVETGD